MILFLSMLLWGSEDELRNIDQKLKSTMWQNAMVTR